MKKFDTYQVASLIAELIAERSYMYDFEQDACYRSIKENYDYKDMTREQFDPIWEKIVGAWKDK
jgi:hypothetical protein